MAAEMITLNQALNSHQEKNDALNAGLLASNDTIATFKLQNAATEEKYAILEAASADKDAQWTQEKQEMQTQLAMALNKAAEAEKNEEFFREKYYEASAYVSNVQKENAEALKRAEIAEGQANLGVETIRGLFKAQVTALRTDVAKWRKQAEDLVERDKRMEPIRERASLYYEVQKENKDLKQYVKELEEENQELEEAEKQFEYDKKVWESERKLWYNEVKRREAKEEQEEQVVQAEDEEVYPCQWIEEGGRMCEEVFEDKEVSDALRRSDHI